MQIISTKIVIDGTKIVGSGDFRHQYFVQNPKVFSYGLSEELVFKGLQTAPAKTETTGNLMARIKFRLDNKNMLVYT